MFNLVGLITLFPLIGFLLNGIFGKKIKNEKIIGMIGCIAIAIPFLISLSIFISILNSENFVPITKYIFDWFRFGDFNVNVAYQIDQLSILFALIVTGIGLLIHIYSIGYMHNDRSFYRFFAYLNLFIFMMLNLVLADNFLVTFFGWEGVGLCSYLLIGFWYDRKFEGVNLVWTGDAGNKAFIANRVGDFGFLIAMFLIFSNFGSLQYSNILTQLELGASSFYDTSLLFWITLSLFLGCCGKSAQLPLSVWLPDAMAGPTPVSALIHAATMVTAGIFLIARNSLMFALSPDVMNIIAGVGVITALWAATIGLVQNDIKKVLAYSTVSQLGFMFAALGVGAFTAGVFHVMTHAFFKGLLFLGAGAVMHSMKNELDMQKMGNLRKYMPITHKTFFIAALAIAGVPFFSGFFSKDEIMWNMYNNGGFIGWLILAIAAFCTAFYMFRLTYMVFYGEERFDIKKVHPHESPKTMTIPLIILAFLSAFGGFIGVPYALGFWINSEPNMIGKWLTPIFKEANYILNYKHNEIHSIEYLFILIAVIIAVLGIYLAKKLYDKNDLTKAIEIKKSVKPVYKVLFNKYYLDEGIYALVINPIINISEKFLLKIVDIKIIDGLVNGLAKLFDKLAKYFRYIQTGLVQNYATLIVIGIIFILTYLLIV